MNWSTNVPLVPPLREIRTPFWQDTPNNISHLQFTTACQGSTIESKAYSVNEYVYIKKKIWWLKLFMFIYVLKPCICYTNWKLANVKRIFKAAVHFHRCYLNSLVFEVRIKDQEFTVSIIS